MMRVFNACEGLTAAADRLPEKFYQPLTGTGPTAGVALDRAEVAQAIGIYYDLAGWDKVTGAPTPDRLEQLGLAWAGQYLK